MFFPRLTFSFLRYLLLFVLGLSAHSWLTAAQLVLRNGDRITGEVVSRENGRILFRSPLLGDISVAEVDAAVDELAGSEETADQQMADSLAGLPPSSPATPTPGSDASPEAKAADPAARKESRPATSVAAQTPPPPAASPKATAQEPAAQATPAVAKTESATKPSRPPWKGKIEFGFKQQSGRNDRIDYDIRADAQRSLGPNSYRANTRVLYSKLNGRLISERHEGSFRWRRDFSKNVFSQSVTTYYSDVVKSIDHNYEQNVGFGYRLLDRPSHVVNAGLGITGQYRETAKATTEGYILGEFFEDYTYKINGRFTLSQNFLAQWSSKSAPNSLEAQNYNLRFNTTLQGRVTTRLSMNVRFEYEFDNAIPNRSARTDQRISSSLGYAF